MKRTKMIAAIVVLGVLAASLVAYGILRYDASIPNTAVIKGYEVALWRTDTNAAVNSIDWGAVDLATTVNTETLLGINQKLTVKNTGDYAINVAWNVTGTLPSGVNVTCSKYLTGSWIDWPINTYAMGINAGAVGSIPIEFLLNIPDNAPRGSINFTINILASNST